jgi:hypothetical protein
MSFSTLFSSTAPPKSFYFPLVRHQMSKTILSELFDMGLARTSVHPTDAADGGTAVRTLRQEGRPGNQKERWFILPSLQGFCHPTESVCPYARRDAGNEVRN